jgi:putative peptidoglycan lipid II flippase
LLTKETASQTGRIARAAGTVSIAVLFSRILGLVREQVFASLFGAGYAYDAYVVAFRIPNLLRDLFAEGALSAAFVTVFTDYDQKAGVERTWRLANNVMMCASLLVGALVLLGMVFAPQLVHLMAPDFGLVPGKLGLTDLMTRVMFPFLLMVSLAALAMGVLNSRGKFFIPALASSFFNLGSIVVGVSLSWVMPSLGLNPIVGMAWGALIGGLLQLMVQLPLLWREGFRPQWVLDLRDEGLRRIGKLMLPAVVGLSATQINIFINTFYAASCPQGSISWLNYAYRLFHLPMGLFGVALMVATMPVVSKHAALDDFSSFKGALESSLALSLLVTMPAACGLIFLAHPIIALIFQHGHFTAWDTQQTAAALALYAFGAIALSGVKIMVPAFYALNNTRIPVMGSFLTVGANLIFINLTLGSLQHRAIALSTSLSTFINLFFLAVMLYRCLGGFRVRPLLLTLGKVAVAGLAMGLTVAGLYPVLSGWLGVSLAGRFLSLMGDILLGAGLYFLLVWRLKVPEFQELAAKFVSRFPFPIFRKKN